MIQEEEEEDIGALEESMISFRISMLNERLSRNDQSDDEPVSNGDSPRESLRPEPRRRCHEKSATMRGL